MKFSKKISKNRLQARSIFPLFYVFLILVFFASMAGCNKDTKPAPTPKSKAPVKGTETAKKITAQKIDKADASQPQMPGDEPVALIPETTPGPVTDSAKDKRDPFKTFIRTVTPVTPVKKSKSVQIVSPLQRYSLDQLKVVGIVMGGQMRKVLLEDDLGKGYAVNIGDAIGNQGGKVIEIRSDKMVVAEDYEDVMGKQRVKYITKRLYPAEGEDNP